MTQVAFIASKDLLSNKLFDISSARDKCLERFVLLRKTFEQHGIQCDTINVCNESSVDVLVCSDISSSLKNVLAVIKSNPAVRVLYIPTEPPVISCLHECTFLAVMPFDRVAFWNDDFVRRYEHGVKCNIGQPMIDHIEIPSQPLGEKFFLVAVTSSKLIKHKNGIHQERFNVFDFFSRKPEGMDLYGVGWGETAYSFVEISYRGVCDTKKEVLQNYKFSICFENAKNYPGLITEKIFDCFAAGTVPIYYGPPNVADYIPEGCFINFERFSNYEELYQFLIAMRDEEYQAYLDATKVFIKSKAYYEFTSKRFAEIVLEQVLSLMKQPAPKRSVLGFKWALLKIVMRHPFYFLKNLKQCRRFLFDLVFSF
jgi:hypothetical protein